MVPTALEEMQQMVASQRGSGDKDGWPFIRSLMKPLMQDTALQMHSMCRVHGRECDVSGTTSRSLTLDIAGPPCVDWSRRGRRDQSHGATAVPYAMWVAQLLISGCYIAIHECTTDFPDWMLEKPLHEHGARTWKLEVFRLDPTNFGVPCKRPRRYTVLWNASRIHFGGSYAEFVNLFFRLPELHGEVFFHAGADLPSNASKTRLENLQAYSDEWRSRCQDGRSTADNICDLNQRPSHGRLDRFVPTLVTQQSVYCMQKRKLLTATECLETQLLHRSSPVYDLAASGALSEAAVRHLAGNGMSAVCIGTLMMYVLASTSPVSDRARDAFQSRSSSSRLF